MEQERKDHRVTVTKALIRKAFTELLAQKPIQEITVRELCERAQIHRGTFYTHYQDIYDLLEQMEDNMLSSFKKTLEPLLYASGKDEKPVQICIGVFQFLKDNYDMCVIMLGDHCDKKFVSQLISLGRDECIGAYSKHFRHAKPEQIEYFYSFVSAGCIGLLRHWVAEGMLRPAEEIAQAAERMIGCGIGYLQSPL